MDLKVLTRFYHKKNRWIERIRLRRRPVNSEEEVNEIHQLIANVYESMDDQARAVLLTLSRTIQDEDQQITLEDKVQAILNIGHTLCCAPREVKNATQLYTKLLVRCLSHPQSEIRLAAIIALAEASIDNLTFQIKLMEIGVLPKLFDLIKSSLPLAGRTIDQINHWSKFVAWTCYAIVNICANSLPNLLLLREMVPMEVEMFKDAAQLEIWRYVWRENYAQTIVQFIDLTVDGVQPEVFVFENTSIGDETSAIRSASNTRCTIL